jgi:hypothetical protein
MTIKVDSPLHVTISGASFVCEGHRYNGALLTGSPVGGVWSSYDTAHALISDSGYVTPVAPYHSVIINYAVSNMCGTFNHAVGIAVYSEWQCDSALYTSKMAGRNDEIIVYPNPNSGTFTVELPVAANETSIEILDIFGRVIERRTLRDTQAEKVNFSLNDLASGTYFIHINSDGIKYEGKLLILKN